MALRIVYEGDEAAAKLHLPVAENLLHKVREFVAASGAGVYSSRQIIDSRSYAYALKIGEMEALHIYVQPLPPAPPPEQETKELPDFLSGVIRAGWLRVDTLPALPGQTGERKVKVLETYKPNALWAERLKRQITFADSTRLAIAPDKQMFSGISDSVKAPADRKPSQYVSIRPSNYTGRMQQLVQVCLGYGVLPPRRVYESDASRRATIIAEGLQLHYDYRWIRTHGVAKGADGQLWLIEICMFTGVVAMPLPVIPDSKRRIGEVKEDMAEVIKMFNGIPNGGGVPVGPLLTKRIKEGTVLQLMTPAELQPFYAHQPYHSACGWAFNSDGTEAHNTCWNYAANNMKRGYHFAVKLQIGEMKKDRQPDEPIAVVTAKLVKVSEGNLYYSPNPPPNGDYPLGKPQPPFKVFEPLIDEMYDFKFWPALRNEEFPEYAGKLMCDTTLLAYFAEDQLKTVRYFYDRHERDENTETSDFNFRTFISDGRWTTRKTTGVLNIPPMFYSSDVDDRVESIAYEDLTQGTVTLFGFGKPAVQSSGGGGSGDAAFANELGGELYSQSYLAEIGAVPYQGGWFQAAPIGRYLRLIYFQQYTINTRTIGKSVSSALALPDGLREGYVYVYFDRGMSPAILETWAYQTVQDHHEYNVWAILRSATGPTERVVASDLGFVSHAKGPVMPGASYEDYDDLIDYGGFASVGTEVITPPDDPPLVTEQRETLTVGVANFQATLFTGHESGGMALYSSSVFDEALAEWKLWYTPVGDLQSTPPGGPPPKVQMAAYYSADLGERHMVYDTKLLSGPGDRKYYGSLLADQIGSERVKFNFIGIP